MRTFTVQEALEATGGRWYGSEDAKNQVVTFVTSDSRLAAPGALFVAFKGARVDGHDFMAGCLEKGAVVCLSEREPSEDEKPCIMVENTLRAIGKLAAWHRSRFDIPVVGITGSVGKTTTKEMIAGVLSARFETHRTEKNFNNELGVPWTLLRLDDKDEASVVEMGISDFGEMRRLTNMVRPKIAVISIIGDAHLEFLHDHAGVLRAKGEIFESMTENDLAVLNGDDATLKSFTPHTRVLRYGIEEGNDFVARNIENLGAEGIRCEIVYDGGKIDARIPGFGVHLVYAALAAATVGHALGMTDAEIEKGIASYKTVGERARVITTEKYTVVSDCYNANPSSVNAALRSLAGLQNRKVAILGDMLELGNDTVRMHYETGEKAAEYGMDLVLTAGTLSRSIAEGAKAHGIEAYAFEKRDELIDALPGLLKEGDAILIKASHSMAFEKITEALTK